MTEHRFAVSRARPDPAWAPGQMWEAVEAWEHKLDSARFTVPALREPAR